jgi:hypothetical protein
MHMVNRTLSGRLGQKKRVTRAAALVAAAFATQFAVSAIAGQAASSFRISIALVNPHHVEPELPASETGCTATSSPTSQVLKCNVGPATPGSPGPGLPGNPGTAGGGAVTPPPTQPPVVAIPEPVNPPLAPPATPTQQQPDPLVASHRTRRNVAGHLMHQAGGDASSTGSSLYHEYSRRIVRLGEVEYQEDMFSW